MTRDAAEDLLQRFKQLEGTYSDHFSSRIERVVVSYKSFTMIRRHKEYLKNNFLWATKLIQDGAEYTIVAVLKSGRIQSIRTLVRIEQIQELYGEVEVVDYMTT
jgi:hypothetical protein